MHYIGIDLGGKKSAPKVPTRSKGVLCRSLLMSRCRRGAGRTAHNSRWRLSWRDVFCYFVGVCRQGARVEKGQFATEFTTGPGRCVPLMTQTDFECHGSRAIRRSRSEPILRLMSTRSIASNPNCGEFCTHGPEISSKVNRPRCANTFASPK